MSKSLTDALSSISEYKIVSETLSGDRFTNIIHIDRIYKAPLWKKRADVTAAFYHLEKTVNCVDGLLIHLYPSGWQDADCKTFGLQMTIIPNGGKVIYTDEGGTI